MLFPISFIFSQILFWSALYHLLVRKDNLILTIISLEIALLGIALLFALNGLVLEDSFGLVIFFYFLTLAGVESALGLALIITYYRIRTSVSWSKITTIKC